MSQYNVSVGDKLVINGRKWEVRELKDSIPATLFGKQIKYYLQPAARLPETAGSLIKRKTGNGSWRIYMLTKVDYVNAGGLRWNSCEAGDGRPQFTHEQMEIETWSVIYDAGATDG